MNNNEKIFVTQEMANEIAKNFISSLSQKQTDEINKQIMDEFFEININKAGSPLNITKTTKNNNTDYISYSNVSETTYLWQELQKEMVEIYKNKLNEKAEEIIHSDYFSKKIDEVANEIINYALEDYKKDVINKIKENILSDLFSIKILRGFS